MLSIDRGSDQPLKPFRQWGVARFIASRERPEGNGRLILQARASAPQARAIAACSLAGVNGFRSNSTFSGEYAKRITEDFAISVAPTWSRL